MEHGGVHAKELGYATVKLDRYPVAIALEAPQQFVHVTYFGSVQSAHAQRQSR